MINKKIIKIAFRLFIPIGLFFLLSELVSYLVMFGYAIGSGIIENKDWFRSREIYDFVQRYSLYISMLVDAVMIPIFFMMFRNDQKKRKEAGIGDTASATLYDFIVIFVLGFLAAIGINGVVAISGIAVLSDKYEAVQQMVYSGTVFVEIVAAAVLAPLVEELLFRGLIQRRLREYVSNKWFVIIISAFVFGFAHGNLVQFVYAFIIGMMLAYVYDKYGTIWASIVLHLGANLISVLLTEFLPERYFTVINVLVATVLGLLGTYLCMKYIIKSHSTYATNDDVE